MKKQAKKDSISFYDVFKIGVEIEGEFVEDYGTIKERTKHFEVAEDSSLRNQFGGNLFELRSNIIDSEEKEKELLEGLLNIEKVVEEGRKQFAYSNRTAGTHFHFSFSEKYKENLKELYLLGANKDYYLYLFDSIDFEKYFFERYFRTFNLSKFWERLNSEFCQSFIKYSRGCSGLFVGNDVNLVEIENIKGGSCSRYKWLNNECLSEGEGLEIRIFPHLITEKGVKDVFNFVKEVLIAYLVKKKTQLLFDDIYFFFENKNKFNLEVKNLRKYDKVLYYSLIGNRSMNNLSMDFIEFYNYIFRKNKTAFIIK